MAFIMVKSTILNFKQLRVLIQQELHFHARYDRVLHPSAGVMQTQGPTPCWSYTTRILWGWKTVAEILPPASFSQWKSAFCRTFGLIEFFMAWGMWHEPCGPVVWESVGVFLPASYPSMSAMNTRTSSTHQLLDYTGAAGSGFLWCVTASSLGWMEWRSVSSVPGWLKRWWSWPQNPECSGILWTVAATGRTSSPGAHAPWSWRSLGVCMGMWRPQ